MKASVIVLAWNGMAYLEGCLDAVLGQDYPDFEVIVVDNGSTDGSADFVAERFPQVRLIRNERNLGFAGGNNVGLRAATGDVLVLLNQDTEVQAGWLAALVEMVAEPDVGIVGCKLLYPDGTIQHAGGRIIDMRGTPWHIGLREIDTGQYDTVQDVDFVTGAAIALTRATLTHIGRLDEGFVPAYYEDTDWCYRAQEVGLRVIYCPKAVAIHYESTSFEVGSYAHRTNYHAGRLRFLFKHQSLEDLQTLFIPAESEFVNNLGPGRELEAMRQAWVRLSLTLPDIVQFRACHIASDVPLQVIWQTLLDIILKLRELCAKEQPFYPVREQLDAVESRAVGTEVLEQATHSGVSIRDEMLASVHKKWKVEPQPFRSEVPVLGSVVAAFREAWISIATRWYVEPLIAQQRAFNAAVTQVLDREVTRLNQMAKRLDRVAVSQIELLHLVRQVADNVERSQQENAQHVRELNTLLSEILRLQTRLTALEMQVQRLQNVE